MNWRTTFVAVVGRYSMDEEKRKKLLREIDRSSATVGRRVPDTITIDDRELDLGEFLVEIRKVDKIPDDKQELVAKARRTLSAERATLRERLETDDLSETEAEELAERIIGIDRALHALRTVRSAGFGEASRSRDVTDSKQWVKFLDQVTN